MLKALKPFWRDPAQWSQFLIFFGIMALYLANIRNTAGVFARDIWREWIVRSSDEPLLDERAAARRQYDTVVAQAADWSLPRPIRDSMRAWQFDTAGGLPEKAGPVLEHRLGLRPEAQMRGETIGSVILDVMGRIQVPGTTSRIAT